MADEQMQPEGIIEEQRTRGGFKSFASTPGGKFVIVGVSLGALMVVAGIAAIIVFVFLVDKADLVVTPNIVPVTGTAPSSSTTQTPTGPSEDSTQVPSEVPYSDIFTFRDIFEPLIKPVSEDTTPTTSSEGTSTDGGSTDFDGEPDVLYLQDITVEDGEEKALLLFNGQQYLAAEGEVVGETPWKVLSIQGDSVVMLYGDSQVTLTVGQGMTSSK